ncbi:MAG: signal peptidase II [Proteobacteria bacterium]|nr:signal peptidase II [Pseudomonadota bacterium]
MKEKAIKLIIAAFIVFIAVFLDQWTKNWAEDNLANVRFPDHYVTLTVNEQNTGTAEDIIQKRYPGNSEYENKKILFNATLNNERIMPQTEIKPGETLELHQVGLTVIDGYYDYQYARNPGAAFSFLANATPKFRSVFFGITGILAMILIAVFIWLSSWKKNKVLILSLACVLGGAIGNVIDRFRLSYVIDFISWHVGDHYWPTFNIADVFVTGGVAFLILAMLVQSIKDKKAVPAEGKTEATPNDEPAKANADDDKAEPSDVEQPEDKSENADNESEVSKTN